MKAIEFISNTDKEGNIRVEYKLSAEKKNVRVIILYEDELETDNDQMKKAAAALYDDYNTNEELISFTNIP